MSTSMQRGGKLLLSKAVPAQHANRQIARYYSQFTRRLAAVSDSPSDVTSMRNQNLVFEDKPHHPKLSASLESEKHSRRLLEKFPDINLSFVEIGGRPPYFHPVYLRDACPCPWCKDPSTTQKTFQTTDIPRDIKASSVEELENGSVKITWESDVPGFPENHVSVYPKKFFVNNRNHALMAKSVSNHHNPVTWNKDSLKSYMQYWTYDQYMTNDDLLRNAQHQLLRYGLVVIKGIPDSETAVEDLTRRLGPIRDSFYGRTWDVKSVPGAKNVAYTHQYLGLHMDLLYMAEPPGLQFLHCLKNSCEGGESIFSDAFNAARNLPDAHFKALSNFHLAYEYKNAGEHYYHKHPIFEVGPTFSETERPVLKNVNYSPPFQAGTSFSQSQQAGYTRMLQSLRAFAQRVEDPRNLFEFKLQPGECVIFNNRRILHGRRKFETGVGERWLKGAYVDTDVFMSRYRVLVENAKVSGSLEKEAEDRTNGLYSYQFMFPANADATYKSRQARKLERASGQQGEETAETTAVLL